MIRVILNRQWLLTKARQTNDKTIQNGKWEKKTKVHIYKDCDVVRPIQSCHLMSNRFLDSVIHSAPSSFAIRNSSHYKYYSFLFLFFFFFMFNFNIRTHDSVLSIAHNKDYKDDICFGYPNHWFKSVEYT